ncbi:MAG TPA: DUF2158 domain-containing protein [Gemmataceae bacterium]|nr:DUF2158 domain-containing protein [Gemmataceae bacterium]
MKAGDVVWLKSGSPAMTIQGQGKMGWVCWWFWHGAIVETAFDAAMLTTTKPVLE